MTGKDHFYYLIKMSYYLSTTTNIIGYGDMLPKSNLEKLWHIPLMLQGQLIAVFILGQFINIIIQSRK
jgi:hypothetical protein